MRATVMLGDNVNMVNVKEVMNTLLDGIDGAEFRFLRTVPNKNFLVEVNVKTPEEARKVYDRAIERW